MALEGDELLGSVSLNECDMDTRADLTPWLGGLLVKPEARGRGVATALVRHLEERAGGMGVRRLYLYTNSARGLYQKLGWQVMGLEQYEGKIVTLMSKEI